MQDWLSTRDFGTVGDQIIDDARWGIFPKQPPKAA